jgi:sulfatase-modifying factor enzyme 1
MKSTQDPMGPALGSARVIRGGSWRYDAQALRSAYRDYGGPGSRSVNVGFRLVRENKIKLSPLTLDPSEKKQDTRSDVEAILKELKEIKEMINDCILDSCPALLLSLKKFKEWK